MTYIWNLDPVAFSLLGLDVRWYGLVYVIGFYLALFWGWKLYRKFESDLSQKEFENNLFWIFVGGIIGGRLGHFLFFNPEPLLADPMEFFRVWHGGMAIQGGLIGAVITVMILKRINPSFRFLPFSDVLVLPLVLMLALGRIANFVNGELVGVPTNAEWGVVFPHIDEVLRHPVVLYESLGHFLIFFDLLILCYFFPRVFRGRGFALFLVGYGIIRMFVEPFKQYATPFVWDFSMGQILSFVMVVVGVVLLVKNVDKN